MATCPACQSERVYRGYRLAPLLFRLIRIHEFLCEGCNLQFRAFSVLPPRTRTRKGKTRKPALPLANLPEDAMVVPIINEPNAKNVPSDNSRRIQAMSAASSGGNQTVPTRPMPTQSEITSQAPPPQKKWEMSAQTLDELESNRKSRRSHQVCPHCGATDTERRRRKLWEKLVFAFTQIRAYNCRICGGDFYARRKKKDEESN